MKIKYPVLTLDQPHAYLLVSGLPDHLWHGLPILKPPKLGWYLIHSTPQHPSQNNKWLLKHCNEYPLNKSFAVVPHDPEWVLNYNGFFMGFAHLSKVGTPHKAGANPALMALWQFDKGIMFESPIYYKDHWSHEIWEAPPHFRESWPNRKGKNE